MENTAKLCRGCPLHSQKSGWVSTALHDPEAGAARSSHSATWCGTGLNRLLCACGFV